MVASTVLVLVSLAPTVLAIVLFFRSGIWSPPLLPLLAAATVGYAAAAVAAWWSRDGWVVLSGLNAALAAGLLVDLREYRRTYRREWS